MGRDARQPMTRLATPHDDRVGRAFALSSLTLSLGALVFWIVLSRTPLFTVVTADGHYLPSTVLAYKTTVLSGLIIGGLGLSAGIVARIRARGRKPLAAGIGALLGLLSLIPGVFFLVVSVYLEVHECLAACF
jgi:hypothetical protein